MRALVLLCAAALACALYAAPLAAQERTEGQKAETKTGDDAKRPGIESGD